MMLRLYAVYGKKIKMNIKLQTAFVIITLVGLAYVLHRIAFIY
jgi:hypothetical protein